MMALADVAVVVSNAKESAEWWERNLGFATYTVGGSGHAMLVAPPGDRFVLHLCEGFAPLEPGDSGIAFVTDEMDPLIARMTAGGVRFPQPLKSEDGGRMAKFSDPDGNVFWLLEASTAMIRETLEMRASREPLERRPKRKARTDARGETGS
jgi:catechol 2,3-dioxygenase-like lactoylglutathione lyase family enzyme